MSQSWRFIDDGHHSGPWNMAMDEALATCMTEQSKPILRAYRFQPPAITIGRFQSFTGGNELGPVLDAGVDVVRRPTGGLALLHKDDFTYSVVLPLEVDGGVDKDRYYSVVAQGVLAALATLGIEAKVASHSGETGVESAWCLEGEFGVDIVCRGRKICGSAQRVFPGSVLQHGSLFFDFEWEMLCEISDGTGQNAPVITLEEAAGAPVCWEETRDAFLNGFRRALGVDIRREQFTEHETGLANELVRHKYNTPGWFWSGEV